ncbi:BREX-2 system adenine-specific DNA-methyltransferase PglX [Salinicola lusitanus]|uniref:site-specific DNA-methyltransferase (adenine-specific) n=1 Tax=Salinicola lusitanus TaxID=1949085 RepID=A0ABZ3CWM9_9GAMM
MMIDREHLLSDLKAELPKIEADILQYSERHAELGRHLKGEYDKAVEAGRTAEHFVAWREAQITQAAAAWVLTCVFVRFLEDNDLLDEPVLSGPAEREDASSPLAHAKERITHHFNEHPAHGEREYLLALFRELDQYPVIDALLDPRHNPLWQIPVSDDGAKRLVDFFQRIDPETGELIHDFTDPEWDTRFLGDLYQDLSESVRKRYALLQTPEFVEEFILDYTLTPAIETFGLEGLRLIDPTCGSGHFLLTTFERVFNAWLRREPATNARHLAQRALDVVHGVDINPYAIAVAKFRLLIAALRAAGSDKIRNAPDFDFHLAVGDSLLHGKRHESGGEGLQKDAFDDSLRHVFESEDLSKLNAILGQRYHVVVGNPPYITVKDKALNAAYRTLYPTCHRKYSLGAPFTERFFDLTHLGEDNQAAGYVGMITSNSFMKREFGKKLIEEYLPSKDLTHVIDTSGAYIPGHGTPTVILFARNRLPKHDKVRAVLGIRGEPSTPKNAAYGKVWRSILGLLERPGEEDSFGSSVDQDRELYKVHPWSLVGGGAGDVRAYLEGNKETLSKIVDLIGFGVILGDDEAFSLPKEKAFSAGFPQQSRYVIEGEAIRDWDVGSDEIAIFPYDKKICFNPSEESLRYLWLLRTHLWKRDTFGKKSFKEAGRGFAEYHQIPVERNRRALSLAFAEVASHNHFVFDRGGKIFKQTAPMIQLPDGTSENDYLFLLGLLNSSTICFWMKQVSHQKQMTGGDGVRVDSKAKVPYQFSGTQLKKLPLPDVFNDQGFKNNLLGLAREADEISSMLHGLSAEKVLNEALGTGNSPKNALKEILKKRTALRSRLVLIQEEIDWRVYHAYGICDSSLLADIDGWMKQGIAPGQRPFEIISGFNQDGFDVPNSVPSDWPEAMQKKWHQRMQAIRDNSTISIVEDSNYKRRWIGRQGLFNHSSRSDELKNSCKNWLLVCLETAAKNNDSELLTGAQLADRVRHDDKFQQVAELYTDNPLFDAQQLVTELITIDEVPQMAPARLKPTAIKKFRAWQETWDKQRQEDAIDAEFGVAEPLSPEDAEDAEKVKGYEAARKQAEAKKAAEVGAIPVPPKYASTDFRKSSYWPLRGKLDVPKERFFSLPGCEKPGDSTRVIGWAGLDHLQRAQAIAGWYMERKEQDGWEPDKLMPMLVALEELIPWLKQWHNELNPEFGERMGEFYENFLFEELRELELTRDDLLAWQPSVARRGRRRKTATSA